jgi:hypothetical protein
MHRKVSQQVHKAFEESFILKNTTVNDINGTSLKSRHYNLFFSAMGTKNKIKNKTKQNKKHNKKHNKTKNKTKIQNKDTKLNQSAKSTSFFDLFKSSDTNES